MTVLNTLPVLSVAVIVMLFAPIDNGMFGADQVVPTNCATADAPVLDDQVTDFAPLPPVTDPERDTNAPVVAAGGTFTVSVNAEGGVVVVCAAA